MLFKVYLFTVSDKVKLINGEDVEIIKLECVSFGGTTGYLYKS
jgi:hypothetical protein